MNNDGFIYCFSIIFIVLFIISLILYCVLKSPFEYPYLEIKIDISGRRKPERLNLIDEYININRFAPFSEHLRVVKEWKSSCQQKISNSCMKKYRNNQYLSCLDDDNMIKFVVVKSQTRYTQRNYVRTPYIVEVEVDEFSCSYNEIKARYKELEGIGFEATLNDYRSSEQRKLMTKQLRKQIAIRDNYTCQICGKYMPDEVGLHIDHIVPIRKGGKSVPSNLQVLCSKCNGKKSDKL